MTPSLKKICIYSLATGIGTMLHGHDYHDSIMWRAEKLREVGQKAMDRSKVNVDNSKVRQADKKIKEVFSTETEFAAVGYLTFLLCGLEDLSQYSSDPLISLMIKRTSWFLELFDAKLDKTEIYVAARNKYRNWSNQESF